MKELVRLLLENLIIDFDGEISADIVRQHLRADGGKEAKALLGKLVADQGVDDLLLVLADTLKERLRTGINEDVVREELATYADS